MGRGKPRKLSLTRVQGEVLWVLEEAGEENMPALVNTLRVIFPALSDEELRAEVDGAVGALSRRGLVYVSPAPEGAMASVILTAAGRAALSR